ncbi:vitamin K epoxide reductase family protein [Nocardia puris]|uniref:Putative membrane protein n=1 Tax=Nocardia puris TaxID=208602 RepID=A0A366DKR9_9NOCA|nr:vitamin K epoxide reductase family protein [Nocardia puris]MBF6365035.1 vitamin K epoxide reductase family protein [Nocardia puris]MBF6458820.1 vitamin K epoxide reductase family protein [Nocardia puris]RBO90672.1 putative membrane protein [Nocardia puris]
MIAASPRAAWLLLIGGLAGWLASVTLTVERFKLFTDPGYVPSCSLNPVLSCGSVMETDQASVFGFPNPILGIVGFSVVVTLGVLAVAGVGLPRWVWGGLWLGTLAGIVFVCWLIFQSLYRIGALCPYCMVVWAVITPLFAVVTDQLWGGQRGPLGIVAEWRWTLVVVFFAVVLLLIFLRFQDYWLSLV